MRCLSATRVRVCDRRNDWPRRLAATQASARNAGKDSATTLQCHDAVLPQRPASLMAPPHAATRRSVADAGGGAGYRPCPKPLRHSPGGARLPRKAPRASQAGGPAAAAEGACSRTGGLSSPRPALPQRRNGLIRPGAATPIRPPRSGHPDPGWPPPLSCQILVHRPELDLHPVSADRPRPRDLERHVRYRPRHRQHVVCEQRALPAYAPVVVGRVAVVR